MEAYPNYRSFYKFDFDIMTDIVRNLNFEEFWQQYHGQYEEL
jgi:hypothetical protein